MIVRDEGDSLGDCLASVKGYVDEIVVVDTGSKDNTVAIAESHGAKVFSFKWCDDFSAARNAAISHATGDWILVLDADERMAPEDLLKMRELIRNSTIQGISLVQQNYTQDATTHGWVAASGAYAQGFRGYFTTRICRIFQNKPHIRFNYAVHELVEDSILQNGGKVIKTDIPIHHYGAAKKQKQKHDKYLALALAQAAASPNNPKPLYEAGVLYKEQKKLDIALAFFQKAAAIDEGYANSYTCIGDIYLELGKLDDAKKFYEKSIALVNDINAWLNLGVVYAQKGKDAEAAHHFEKVLSIEPRFVQAYNNLYALLLKTRRYVAAWRLLKVAAEKTGLSEFAEKKDMLRKKLLATIEKELKAKPDDRNLLAARAELIEG